MKNNSLSYNIARIISILFVPPTFTVFLFIYFSFLIETDLYNRLFIIGTAVIFGFILPVIVFTIMRKGNKISDIDTSIKEERNAPYLLNSIFCLSAIPPLFILKVDNFFLVLWILFFINTLILYLINKNWKISAHLIAANISMGALVFIESNTAYLIFALMVIIGWARIKLGIHNFAQVLAGGMLGFLLTYLGLFLFYYLVG